MTLADIVPNKYLKLSVGQHCGLGEAVPALHQVDHVEHCQEGQRDVDIAAVARALRVQDVVGVGHGGGVHVGAGRGDEDVHAAESTPGQRSKAAVHEEGQEEALPVGLPAQGGAQRLLDWPLLQGKTEGGCQDETLEDCVSLSECKGRKLTNMTMTLNVIAV